MCLKPPDIGKQTKEIINTKQEEIGETPLKMLEMRTMAMNIFLKPQGGE